MKAFGRDELKGRQDKPLKKFRGMFAWKQSINDEIYELRIEADWFCHPRLYQFQCDGYAEDPDLGDR